MKLTPQYDQLVRPQSLETPINPGCEQGTACGIPLGPILEHCQGLNQARELEILGFAEKESRQ